MKFGLFLLILLWFIGCGNDSRFDSGDVPRLNAFIHFVPEQQFGSSPLLFASVRNKAIAQGESGKFSAEIRVGGESVPDDRVSEFVLNFSWEILGKRFASSSVTQHFPDSGIFDAVLHTVDFFGDTLHDTLSLYVTTPLSIAAVFPEDNDNSIDPFDSAGVLFRVETSGVNSWQNALCSLYISMEKSSVWDSPLDEIPCNGTFSLRGPLSRNDTAFFSDTSYSLYWAVKAIVPDSELPFDRDSSAIRTISTALMGTDYSMLLVPIRYKFLPSGTHPEGVVFLINAAGDTLDSTAFHQNPATIRFSNLNAGTFRISVQEKRLVEYGSLSREVDLRASTFSVLDTLLLNDSISPNRVAASAKTALSDSVRFFLYDGGSGVSEQSILVLQDRDTLEYSLNGDVLSFSPTCSFICNVSVFLRDFAGNAAVPVQWMILTDGDSLEIRGPFNPEER